MGRSVSEVSETELCSYCCSEVGTLCPCHFEILCCFDVTFNEYVRTHTHSVFLFGPLGKRTRDFFLLLQDLIKSKDV